MIGDTEYHAAVSKIEDALDFIFETVARTDIDGELIALTKVTQMANKAKEIRTTIDTAAAKQADFRETAEQLVKGRVDSEIPYLRPKAVEFVSRIFAVEPA